MAGGVRRPVRSAKVEGIRDWAASPEYQKYLDECAETELRGRVRSMGLRVSKIRSSTALNPQFRVFDPACHNAIVAEGDAEFCIDVLTSRDGAA
ncbi:hypothetical protein HH308_18050 [Gordonia sp. TBRC 11910]|uniref:Uncharacterized protein n=1 Tax=Gordonia asplenii TaxID=2725283 RepID=A0A848L684_9ACTN|nr:hypothetical protein [Gordonia asplenii]NMO03118.1 hypothetical protein [Gordonia asplenii]